MELEEKMADLHEKIMQLEKQNSGLKSKVSEVSLVPAISDSIHSDSKNQVLFSNYSIIRFCTSVTAVPNHLRELSS